MERFNDSYKIRLVMISTNVLEILRKHIINTIMSELNCKTETILLTKLKIFTEYL